MSDRELLLRLANGPASGAALARELGLTRAAIWKRVQNLRDAGVDIDAHPTRGYALAMPLTLLDAMRIGSALAPAARAELAGLQVDFETDSTQARALAAPPPAQGCAVFLAERQTAGRGRRGRSWASPLAAHLYVSVARRFAGGFASLGGLSLAVGVAVAEALRSAGVEQVALKWPNDLVVADRKLGGILIDLRGEAQGPCEAVIGIGLNWRMPAAAARGIDQPWCDLATLAPGAWPDRNALAVHVLDALLPALARFEHDGLAPFAARWRALDALAGRPVRVLDGERRHEGTALGIDATGALRVRHADGERCWHSGEVSVRDAAHDRAGAQSDHAA
jgi:BirA family biotin operon repressor/biotin-[acetyl-CoA-carboxylase] ligase